MKNSLQLVLAITATFLLNFSYSQAQITVTFTDGGSVEIPCGIPNTFEDGYGGAYPANEDQTYTVCVEEGTGLTVSFSFSAEEGGYFDIHESDTLYVYDGPDVNAPLLAALNNTTAPFNAATGNTTLSNESGCMTFQFVTDGADEGEGFQGVVNCNYSCQPIEPWFITNPDIVPNDSSGAINICLGDTVTLSAVAGFPMSAANGGAGYNQTLSNSTIEWFIFGEPTQTGTSIEFVPDQRAGYFVDMLITDTLGCFENARTRVQVSTIPSFSETGVLESDTICLGETAEIIAGVTPSDTVGVDPTEGNFLNGGLFGDALELPDGSGTIDDIYTTTINIGGFEPGDTVVSGSDIQSLCISMEHSFLGDLEMWLTCPGATDSVIIFNAYDGNSSAPGFVPGGFSPGGINLGIPNLGSGQGTCFDYCFSVSENDLGTFADEFGNMGSEMDAGTYLPEESFDGLIGCPLNGDWSLSVADSWPADDGWICEWGITFDSLIDPNQATYTPAISEGFWSLDPTIISNQQDTLIVVEPQEPGDNAYTFNVVDDFGCAYDTTVQLHTVPTLTSFTDQSFCGDEYELEAAEYEILGEWNVSGPGPVDFSPSTTDYNPTVSITEFGDYEFIYTSDYCGQSDTVVIDFNPIPSNVSLADQTVCPGTDLEFDAQNEDIGATYAWSPGGFDGQVLTLDSVTQTTGIQVTVTNDCGTANGAATITVHSLDIAGPLEACQEGDAVLTANLTTPSGAWTYEGPEGATATILPDETDENPTITVDSPGAYQFTFTDDECGMEKTWEVNFAPTPTITASSDTSLICVDDEIMLTYAVNTDFYDELSWSPFTSTEDTLIIAGTDSMAFNPMDTNFVVTASISNFCGTDADTLIYDVITCELVVPSIFNPESGFSENSYFNIEALNLHPGNNVKIFDRWGRKVYEADDYHLNPWNGDKQSDGVYYYVLEREGGYDAVTGYVHLVRGTP